MSSLFTALQHDPFHGADRRGGKIPDGTGGKSMSRYSTVDKIVSIPVGHSTYFVSCASSEVPIKCFTFKTSENKNLLNVSTGVRNDTATLTGVSGGVGYYYDEIKWRETINPTVMHLTSRSLLTTDTNAQGTLWAAKSIAESKLVGGDEQEDMPMDLANSDLYPAANLMQPHQNNTTLRLHGVDSPDACPLRWRCVSLGFKMQPLSVPEFTAGYWRSVDFFPSVNASNMAFFASADQARIIRQGVLSSGGAVINAAVDDCLVVQSTSSQIRFAQNMHYDLKMLNEYIGDEQYYAEKKSYNEGSVESMRAVQFNLQRREGERKWCEGAFDHSGTDRNGVRNAQKRTVSDRSFVSKFPVAGVDAASLTALPQFHNNYYATSNPPFSAHFYSDRRLETTPNIVPQGTDRITTEIFNAADALTADFKAHNNNRMYGSSGAGGYALLNVQNGLTSSPTKTDPPWCFSSVGFEDNAGVMKVLESHIDDNLSLKIVCVHNTGKDVMDIRVAVAASFEITPDADSAEANFAKPVLYEDAKALKDAKTIGNSATRRKSRYV